MIAVIVKQQKITAVLRSAVTMMLVSTSSARSTMGPSEHPVRKPERDMTEIRKRTRSVWIRDTAIMVNMDRKDVSNPPTLQMTCAAAPAEAKMSVENSTE
mmetsp:Transcript_31677/g.59076  ORF Transcript_31677/g.59076 Transcript_31677/m.59076 type:complete len:100 (+) Transcript_31677:581-880(+)